MMKILKYRISGFIFMAILGGANTSNAATVTATGSAVVNGIHDTVTQINTLTSASASSPNGTGSVFTFGGGVDASSTVDGVMEVQAFGGEGEISQTGVTSWDLLSTATWSDVLVNTTTVSQSYALNFLIPGGHVTITSGSGKTSFASYLAKISADTATLFSAGIALDSTSAITFQGTNLGGVYDDQDFDTDIFRSYSWSTFSSVVNINVAANSSVNLSYEMIAVTNGTIPGGFMPENDCKVGTAGGNACFGRVGFSDPLGTDVITSLELTSVPVPASVWLFSSGVFTLLGFLHRKKIRV